MGYSGCGRYVRFTDYENLQSECDSLKEENGKLKLENADQRSRIKGDLND